MLPTMYRQPCGVSSHPRECHSMDWVSIALGIHAYISQDSELQVLELVMQAGIHHWDLGVTQNPKMEVHIGHKKVCGLELGGLLPPLILVCL